MIMTPQRILSGALLIGGLVLLLVGLNDPRSVNDQISNTLYGRFNHGATWYLLGGLAAAMLGLYLLVTDLLSKRTLAPMVSRRRK